MLFTRRYGYILKAGCINDYFKILSNMGCKWDRSFGFSWSLCETKPGAWDFKAPYIEGCLHNNIKLLIILGCSLQHGIPKWAESKIPVIYAGKHLEYIGRKRYFPKLNLWDNYIKEIASHLNEKADAYEVFNETGRCDPETYVKYAERTYKTIKTVNPAIRIVGPDVPSLLPKSSDEDSWQMKVLNKGLYNYLDIFSVHFYPPGKRGTRSLESSITRNGLYIEQLRNSVNFFKSEFGNKPIWNTEYGLYNASKLPRYFHPAHFNCRGHFDGYVYSNEKRHAERFIRWNLIQMVNSVKKSFYHIFPNFTNSFQSYQSMCHPDMSPKIIVGAYAQSARRLADPECLYFKYHNTLFTYIFKSERKHILVYYNINPEKERDIKLNIDFNEVIIEDLMGNKIKTTGSNGNFCIPLSTSPVYIIAELKKIYLIKNEIVKGQ